MTKRLLMMSSPGRVFLFSGFLLLCLRFTYSENFIAVDRPILIPDIKEYQLTSGETLTLECSGNQPVTWTYPNISVVDDELLFWSTIQVSVRQVDSFNYSARLQLFNASYLDTGFYHCHYNKTFHRDIDEDEEGVSSVYVYVEDDEHLLVPHHDVVKGIQYRPVVIPCRPTSPKVSVELKKEGHEVALESNYNPKAGIEIPIDKLSDAGIYECIAYKDSLTETKEFWLYIMPHSESIAKPFINDTNMGHVAGQTLRLVCNIRYDQGVHVRLEWKVPDPAQIRNNRILISPTTATKEDSDAKYLATNILTIPHLRQSDSGTYTCHVTDHLKNENNASKVIEVLEEGTSYLTLTGDSNSTRVKTEPGHNTVQWIVKVDAYPPPKLEWFNNKDEVIPEGWSHNRKYHVIVNLKDTKLKIMNIKLEDNGVYTLRATNDKLIKDINYTLIVQAPPSVEITGSAYHLVGQPIGLQCEAAANPLPKIQWFFKPCLNDECEFQKETGLKTENKTENLKVTSFITLQKYTSGIVKCEAKNQIGSDYNLIEYIITDFGNDFKAWLENGDKPVAVGDQVVFTCAASKHNFSHSLAWYRISNETEIRISNKDGYSLKEFETEFSFRLNLTIKNVHHNNTGLYQCLNGGNIENVALEVKDAVPPTIVQTNLNGTEIKKKLGEPVELYCIVDGIPIPAIQWLKNDRIWEVDKRRIFIRDMNQKVYFVYTQGEDEASYSCQVTSRVGFVSRTTYLVFIEKSNVSAWVIALIVIITLLLLSLVAYLYYKNRKERSLRKDMTIAALANFEVGGVENLNPELSVDDQAELLPYDKKWEFPRDKLKLGKQLGSGAFGVVMKAEAYGLSEDGEPTIVAVKMVKRNADFTYIKALASELKIMVHLGQHINVVNLLGACTKNVCKKELLVIVEFCRFGNLHNYLLRHRDNFINQLDPDTGEIDINKVLENNHSKDQIGSNSEPSTSVPLTPLSPTTSACIDYRTQNFPEQTTASTMCQYTTEGNVSMAPEGEDLLLMSNNSVQPEWRSNVRGDYQKNTVQPICSQDLLCWAFQVARGMEYLASRRVLHGDLAARNILLADNNVVKICDFGLAKSMYKNEDYRKKGDGPLPIKWMALESIRDRIFSTQSDVWSFGIVLWEFFSLARTPYPGMPADERFYNKLSEGYRMERPEFSPKRLFEIMLQCWEALPKNRPSFSDLAEKLGSMLELSVREHYIDLNSPYLMMNDQQKSQNDYLSMMCRPDFETFVSPQSGSNYYINDLNSPHLRPVSKPSPVEDETGYLCMRPPNSALFSPRPTNGLKTDDSTVFKFDESVGINPNAKAKEIGQREEMIPMLTTNPPDDCTSDTENGIELSPVNNKFLINNSISNPTYQASIFPKNPENKVDANQMISGQDNYVNMPKKVAATSVTTNSSDFSKASPTISERARDLNNEHFYINNSTIV